jgi:hypothetical protein
MKYTTPFFVANFLLAAALAISFNSYSQKKNEEVFLTKWAPKNLQVDGKLNDWTDSLLYNEATKLSYTISSNDSMIFVGIKNKDRQELIKILNAGISFSVNTQGKKKPLATITFPIAERRAVRINPKPKSDPPSRDEIKKMQQEMLSRVKSIKVTGFKEIMDGTISLYNTYGIKAATTFNDKDELEIELAIPLSSLGIDENFKNPIYYNIKINGPARPSNFGGRDMNNGRSGAMDRSRMGGGMYDRRLDGMDRNKISSSSDFWIKSMLAKKLGK